MHSKVSVCLICEITVELCHNAKHKVNKGEKIDELLFVEKELQTMHWKAFNVKEMEEVRAATENEHVKQENMKTYKNKYKAGE